MQSTATHLPRQADPPPVRAAVAGSIPTRVAPKDFGFVVIPHDATKVRGMSDAAFRAWVALDYWVWRGDSPSNAGLAERCGWRQPNGKPSVQKALRALRELESLGLVRRVTGDADGYPRREGIKVTRPKDWGQAGNPGPPSNLMGAPINPDRGPLSLVIGPPPSNLMGTIKNRCRQGTEELPRSPDGGSEVQERQRPGPPPTRTTPEPAAETIEPADTPPPSEPPPTAPAESPYPADAPLTPQQRAFLDALSPDRRARFNTFRDERKAELLGMVARGMEKVALAEIRPGPLPKPERPEPATTPELLAELPGAPPHWPASAAEALARDFGTATDRKLWSAFEQVTRAVWLGRFPAEALVDAHRQGMGPKAKNRGAVFNTALKRHGFEWGAS